MFRKTDTTPHKDIQDIRHLRPYGQQAHRQQYRTVFPL